jgi:hypothetical protein
MVVYLPASFPVSAHVPDSGADSLARITPPRCSRDPSSGTQSNVNKDRNTLVLNDGVDCGGKSGRQGDYLIARLEPAISEFRRRQGRKSHQVGGRTRIHQRASAYPEVAGKRRSNSLANRPVVSQQSMAASSRFRKSAPFKTLPETGTTDSPATNDRAANCSWKYSSASASIGPGARRLWRSSLDSITQTRLVIEAGVCLRGALDRG